MEKLKLKYQDAVDALKTFEDILKEPYSQIIQDASIQRFEYTFEALWKFLRAYLDEKQGIYAGGPKGVFREMLSLGFLDEAGTEAFLEMTDQRNLTVHAYKKKLAKEIFGYLRSYAPLMKKLLKKFEKIKL